MTAILGQLNWKIKIIILGLAQTCFLHRVLIILKNLNYRLKNKLLKNKNKEQSQSGIIYRLQIVLGLQKKTTFFSNFQFFMLDIGKGPLELPYGPCTNSNLKRHFRLHRTTIVIVLNSAFIQVRLLCSFSDLDP